MFVPLVLWALIFIFIFPIYLVSVIGFGLWRLLVNTVVYTKRKELVAHFTSRDIAFTSDDFEGRVRKSVINVTVVEGALGLQTLRESIRTKLLDQPFFFKLHCTPVLFMGYWFWKRTEIKLETHVFEHPDLKTDEELKTFLPAWVATPYPAGTPLWSVMLLRLTGNRTAMVFKLHHMVGDGVSFMKLLECLSVGWQPLQSPELKKFSWIHWIYAWYNFPWNALKAYRLARIRKGFRPNIYCGEGFSSWTELPLEKIRVVRRYSKCLFQSVMGGIMSNAIHRLMEKSGKAEIPPTIRLVIPVPWPDRSEATLTNHVAWLHAELPIGGGMEALRGFDANVKQSYRLGMHGVMWEFFRGMYLIPEPLLKGYTTWGETNIPPVILSSIPGTMGTVHIFGLRVLHPYPVLSLGCSMGLTSVVTTYEDKANFHLRVSKEVLPSQELLDLLVSKYIHEELESLYQQALSSQEKDINTNHVRIHISEK